MSVDLSADARICLLCHKNKGQEEFWTDEGELVYIYCKECRKILEYEIFCNGCEKHKKLKDFLPTPCKKCQENIINKIPTD